jgi:hypothetical protein
MVSFFSIPLIAEMPYVLSLWLKNVPENTTLFCRLVLFSSLISQLTYGLQSGIQAVGRIKNYQIILGISRLLILPLTFVLLKIGQPVHIAVSSFIFVEIINLLVRLHFSVKLPGVKIKNLLIDVFLRFIFPFLLVCLILLFPLNFIQSGFMRLIITILSSSFSLLILSKLMILDKNEYQQIKNILINFIDICRKSIRGRIKK